MNTYDFHTFHQDILADTLTPVGVYLRLRDKFADSVLLESSDFQAGKNSFSYICCNPIASFKVADGKISQQFPNDEAFSEAIDDKTDVMQNLQTFASRFKMSKTDHKCIQGGLFGYIAYDAVRYFESVDILKKTDNLDIPDLHYAFFKNVIAINHFKNEAYLFCHSLDGKSNLDEILGLLQNSSLPKYKFERSGEKTANISEDDYLNLVGKAKSHCQRGDVFQLVLSRRFSQRFKGDDFNVYRTLRSINPSPYLFYFDYGNFKIFGSSPEAQLVVDNAKAEIHPIAGTFKRSGNDEQDAILARTLSEDPKENAEHVMLVDLARNDLSRNATQVTVEKYAELQFFSHVIHLVSKVTGKLRDKNQTLQAVADTFPAGTLSGAPKHRAMQLIEELENRNRSFYGGAIGFIDFDGNFNHAIMIRTFLSKNNTLHFQAGAGLTAASDEKKELQETYNKLGALEKAIALAETI
ncbi:anthranilate synthase component I family protein [Flavobacterium sp. MAH-1]|uniref:Anthranilate synthase component 1 n=1 Tax=Flavobacterium agri TaxID=2743471 RepID=A0A7Y9C7A5_9FLAO|nr:anthranilate synthase component I family protein [Flavobacterium agri]NUY82160.1 anthranilate synthase component I family protein [Flavobacterium agri]NYA72184.1 anthranilate synthase component I family protein [Flavobacterium agri]